MVLALLFLVTSTTNVQLLQNRISDFALNSLTCGTSFLVWAVVLVVKREWPLIKREVWPALMLSVTNNFLFPATLFIDVRLLPIATVESIIQVRYYF